jgi:hypothetical protein
MIILRFLHLNLTLGGACAFFEIFFLGINAAIISFSLFSGATVS